MKSVGQQTDRASNKNFFTNCYYNATTGKKPCDTISFHPSNRKTDYHLTAKTTKVNKIIKQNYPQKAKMRLSINSFFYHCSRSDIYRLKSLHIK